MKSFFAKGVSKWLRSVGISERNFPPKKTLCHFKQVERKIFDLGGAFAIAQCKQVRDIFSNTLVDRCAAVRISERTFFKNRVND